MKKSSKLRQELLVSVVFSGIYFTLNIFRYHIEKYITGLPIGTLILLTYLLLFVFLVIDIFKIIRRRKKSKGKIKLKFIYYLPAIILLVAILYRFSPVQIDSEKLESKTIVKGCYETLLSHATIRIRANKTFDIKWLNTGADNDWYSGTYTQKKDTFILTYQDKAPDKFGSIILNDGRNLISLDKSSNPMTYFISFTIGDYCR